MQDEFVREKGEEMFRIGEFSKMGMATIKTLRYYDEVGLLAPKIVDDCTGYRFYDTDQLLQLHRIQALRQVGLSIDEIKRIVSGGDSAAILSRRAAELEENIIDERDQLSRIRFILQGKQEVLLMSYSTTIKELPACIVYSKKMIMPDDESFFTLLPALGRQVMERYPDLERAKPEYCYTVSLDHVYKETDNHIEYFEAVTEKKPDFDGIVFKESPAVTVASVMHKGPYQELPNAYAFLLKWIENNGYEMSDMLRTRYIDGIWNKESEDEWLTEVQVPIVKA